MHIRPGKTTDNPTLLNVWLRSVWATHTFLREALIQTLLHLREKTLQ